MANNSDDQDERLSRLHARAERSMVRRSAPDGGSVYSGAIVRRSLKAIGARAMTMDNTIFVSEDFDLSKSEDKALYAHERHHLKESGGTAGHQNHDAEEAHARQIEHMVFHRSESGEDFGAILRDVADGHVDQDAAGPENSASAGLSKLDAAIRAELKSGKSQQELIRELADFVVETVAAGQNNRSFFG